MEVTELEESLRQLDNLAHKEYHAALADIVSNTDDSAELRMLRLGRLLGVTLKQPFATYKDLSVSSPFSRAYRAWELNLAAAFNAPLAQSSWQYRTLEMLRTNPDVIQSLGW